MTLQSPTATLMPLFPSSELTGCRYPGLLDWKNCSDMCPQWESNPRLPACKGSTLSTRPGSPPDTVAINPPYIVHVPSLSLRENWLLLPSHYSKLPCYRTARQLFATYRSLPKTSNNLNIRTLKIIAKYNFEMFPKISNSG